jgi:hypothetical protein
MTSDNGSSPVQLTPRPTTRASRARYRLLCSMLTTYGYGMVGLAVAPAVIPVRQPPIWISVGELGLAIVFLATAFFIAPRGSR